MGGNTTTLKKTMTKQQLIRRFWTNKGIGVARPMRAGAVTMKDVRRRPSLQGVDTVQAMMAPIDFGRYHGRGVYHTILHRDGLTSNWPYHIVHWQSGLQ